MIIGAGLIGVSAPARTAEPAPANQVASLAGAPAGVVDQLYAGLLDTMRNGQQLGGEGRYRKLAPTVDRAFNLALMTEVAVGPRWSTLAPEQQRKLIEAFRRFTIASYANHFDGYDGERFAIAPEPQPVQAGVLVRTRLVTRDKPIALDYVLRETDGRWQIVDVYAEGTISEVARRRSEFNAVLSRSGADALADRLVEKAQTLIKEPA